MLPSAISQFAHGPWVFNGCVCAALVAPFSPYMKVTGLRLFKKGKGGFTFELFCHSLFCPGLISPKRLPTPQFLRSLPVGRAKSIRYRQPACCLLLICTPSMVMLQVELASYVFCCLLMTSRVCFFNIR